MGEKLTHWKRPCCWEGLGAGREGDEKVGLKLNIQKTKIIASGPITSWQIDGETVEIVTDFILGGSKITADGDCTHEIKSPAVLPQGVPPRGHGQAAPSSARSWRRRNEVRAGNSNPPGRHGGDRRQLRGAPIKIGRASCRERV